MNKFLICLAAAFGIFVLPSVAIACDQQDYHDVVVEMNAMQREMSTPVRINGPYDSDDPIFFYLVEYSNVPVYSQITGSEIITRIVFFEVALTGRAFVGAFYGDEHCLGATALTTIEAVKSMFDQISSTIEKLSRIGV